MRWLKSLFGNPHASRPFVCDSFSHVLLERYEVVERGIAVPMPSLCAATELRPLNVKARWSSVQRHLLPVHLWKLVIVHFCSCSAFGCRSPALHMYLHL